MGNVPEKIRIATKGQRITYWGRRKIFEMVEESSDALVKAVLIILMFGSAASGLELYSRRPIVDPRGWWAVCLIVVLFVAKRFIKEYLDWYYELFAVSSDDMGGGRIYHWKGWLEEVYFPEAITKTSPNVSSRRPWYYKFWGWLTGEQMCMATIKSQNNIEIKAKKVDPKFVKAIEEIQMGLHNDGNQPGSLLDLRAIREIERAVDSSLLDWQDARDAAKTIVKRQVYG